MLLRGRKEVVTSQKILNCTYRSRVEYSNRIMNQGLLAFVTVGSTRFDSLVQSALSSPVLFSLSVKGYTRLAIQCGDSSFELASTITHSRNWSFEREGISVELWKFKPSLQEEYERADLVISHAGMPRNKKSQVVAKRDVHRIWDYSRHTATWETNDRGAKPHPTGQSSRRTGVGAVRITPLTIFNCCVSSCPSKVPSAVFQSSDTVTSHKQFRDLIPLLLYLFRCSKGAVLWDC